MRELYIKAQTSPKFEFPTLEQRKQILTQRLSLNLPISEVVSDLIDPLMFARLQAAVYNVNGHVILHQGFKPYTELAQSKMALRFLELCDDPAKYNFYERYANPKQSVLPVLRGKVHRDMRRQLHVIEDLRQSVDSKVVKQAVRNLQIKSHVVEMEPPRFWLPDEDPVETQLKLLKRKRQQRNERKTQTMLEQL